MKKSTSGFTIVELLVVIVTIAILAAVSVVAYNGIQGRARDSRRMSDIQSINTALQLYVLDKNKAPDFGGACSIQNSQDSGCFVNDFNGGTAYIWASLQSELSPYIKTLPKDPCGKACFNKRTSSGANDGFFTYRYNAPAIFVPGSPGGQLSATSYTIWAQNLESKSASFGYGFGSF